MNSKPVLLGCWFIVLLVGGCQAVRWFSTPFWRDHEEFDVQAQYRGLESKQVAVLVAADEYMLFHYPTVQLEVSRSVSARIDDNMPTVTVMDPQRVVAYQDNTPYWHTMRYGELIEGLGVERLVLIELIEYRAHEPGNTHVWQGVITGNVGVIEVDADDPDDLVFYTTVRAQFPESSKVGVINNDEESIRLGMHTIFSRDAAGLFYDHKVTKPRVAGVD